MIKVIKQTLNVTASPTECERTNIRLTAIWNMFKSPSNIRDGLYLVHIRAVMSLLYVNIRLMHTNIC